ncbi:hypothetical protein EV207_10828 [Scopulibacillus darangshiensis]|uniref:Uncharacterized protein n=1 Tax=Scopulibacillus darangshiensis TaxID=442528 RepID=A0A4R2P4Z7_9BACL|nr:hypothetical protein [Scopulibacillus darangshiensis]TCP29737.1 hypothetical protein EV207_10828 [Scopulibacillus darangshiensis]
MKKWWIIFSCTTTVVCFYFYLLGLMHLQPLTFSGALFFASLLVTIRIITAPQKEHKQN